MDQGPLHALIRELPVVPLPGPAAPPVMHGPTGRESRDHIHGAVPTGGVLRDGAETVACPRADDGTVTVDGPD